MIPTPPPTAVLGVYAGAVAPLAGGRDSAIVKAVVPDGVAVGRTGIVGDAQADRRLHGGPDQAVHHFPAEHYAALAATYPHLAEVFAGGAIGENVSTRGVTEENVCLGDIFTLGGTRLQVTRPRRPCGKIDRRFATDGLAAHIAARGICGWYYRVLAPGVVRQGDVLELAERPRAPVSLAEFHATMRDPRPPAGALERLAAIEVLGRDWLNRLRDRLRWLARHGQRNDAN